MKKIVNKWPIILMVFSLFIMVIAGLKISSYYIVSDKQLAKEEELRSIYQASKENSKMSTEDAGAEKSAPADSGAEEAGLDKPAVFLTDINPDYVGWIEKEDLGISYPVVQRDNTFYLNHNFEQEADRHGTIFLDEKCAKDSVIHLLHGHHMRDGSMFAGLKKLENHNYVEEHNTFLYDSGDGEKTYLIYAVALLDFSGEVSKEERFYYYRLPRTVTEYEKWQETLEKKALYYDKSVSKQLEAILENYPQAEDTDNVATDDNLDIPAKEENSDNSSLKGEIVVLSTCEYKTETQRLIVVGICQEG